MAPTMEREAGKTDPTEVQLVELLQDIDYLTNNERCATIPLVIVVSAWDVAEKKYSTPEDCLVARTPLLWQYLKANNDVFAVSYFGVSAQGGAFESEGAINELYNQFEDCPAERIIVVDNTGKRSHDITLPLWEEDNRDNTQFLSHTPPCRFQDQHREQDGHDDICLVGDAGTLQKAPVLCPTAISLKGTT